MQYLVALLIASSAFAATLDQQIDAAQDSLAAYQLRVQQLQSQAQATRLDSLYQADSTLAADRVRVVRSNDAAWVNVVMAFLTPLDLRSAVTEVRATVARELVQVKGDTLYMQYPAARAALPVISAALKN